MSKCKDLYMANSLSELNKLADKVDVKLNSAKNGISTYEKLTLAAKEAFLDLDEERAYVLYLRALTTYQAIRKHPEYVKDKKYFDSIIFTKDVSEITKRAEELQSSLKNRYEEKEAKNLVEKIEERESKRGNQFDKPFVNDKNSDSSFSKSASYFTAQDLYNCVKKNSEKTLLFDLRSASYHSASTIKHDLVIHIDPSFLKPGMTVSNIESLLSTSDLPVWKARRGMDVVVILDVNSRVDNMDLNNPAKILKNAIFEWDAHSVLKTEPVIFDGGYETLVMYYPSLVTNPSYRHSEIDDTAVSDGNPFNFSYPDLTSAKKKQELEQKRLELLAKVEEMKKPEIGEESPYTLSVSVDARTNGSDSTTESSSTPHDTESSDSLDTDIAVKDPLDSTVAKVPTIDRSSKPNVSTTRDIKKPVNADHKVEFEKNLSEIEKIDELLKIKSKELEDIENRKRQEASQLADLMRTRKKYASELSQPANSSYEAPARLSQSTEKPATKQQNAPSVDALRALPKPTPTNKQYVLPTGWERRFDSDTNRFYFINHSSKKTYWNLPQDILSKMQQQVNDNMDKTKENAQSAIPKAVDSSSRVTTEKLKDYPSKKLTRTNSQPNLANLAQDHHNLDAGSSSSTSTSSTAKELRNLSQKAAKLRDNFSSFDAQTLRRLSPDYGNVYRGLTGLRNMGNTCYMNSIIQALNNTSLLVSYFLNKNFSDDLNRANPLGHRGELAEQFAVVVFALWSGSYTAISPTDFKYTLGRHAEAFAGHEQQDSQEFLLFLMDGLHEDLNRVRKREPQIPDPNEDNLTDIKRAELSWNRHKAINKSIIVELFQGQFKSTLVCHSCNYRSVTFDAFMYLSLPISSSNRCTLLECLSHFLREEKLVGNSQWFCPKCKRDRNASKKIDIWKLPPYLLIHLKRFSADRSGRSGGHKLNTMVDFPLEGLDLSTFLKFRDTRTDRDPPMYHLYAVSNHFGNMESGHYTAFCKNPELEDWFRYDDDFVSNVKTSEVRTVAAYILFYSKVKTKFKVNSI